MWPDSRSPFLISAVQIETKECEDKTNSGVTGTVNSYAFRFCFWIVYLKGLNIPSVILAHFTQHGRVSGRLKLDSFFVQS
ncbi:hypothetical protein V6N13_038292 [Hibiscus sabdariffa]|uniref:Uncharacterized protein n=1 Tax=Hibiscus sabdariffa TaxID=183260 RepID=A0ABR2S336_9ROSI